MVTFNKKEDTITIVLKGDENKYMDYCRSLARIVSLVDFDICDQEGTVRDVSCLLNDMLPGPNQDIKIV